MNPHALSIVIPILVILPILYLRINRMMRPQRLKLKSLWLRPAIVGGIIMGLGFILGGYCPGTSVCAASIGKVDAMFFVGG